jgi:hypothetical protein
MKAGSAAAVLMRDGLQPPAAIVASMPTTERRMFHDAMNKCRTVLPMVFE